MSPPENQVAAKPVDDTPGHEDNADAAPAQTARDKSESDHDNGQAGMRELEPRPYELEENPWSEQPWTHSTRANGKQEEETTAAKDGEGQDGTTDAALADAATTNDGAGESQLSGQAQSDISTTVEQPPPPPPKDELKPGAFPARRSSKKANTSPRVPQGDDAFTSERQPAASQDTGDFDETHNASTDKYETSRPEIENIMSQFSSASLEDHGAGGTGAQEGANTASTGGMNLPVFQRPPRSSSLQTDNDQQQQSSKQSNASDAVSVSSARSRSSRPESISLFSPTTSHNIEKNAAQSVPQTPFTPSLVDQPPLPNPDPDPSLPFDFHRFLAQLRHRSADPVAKFLRSFLQEFGKRQWMVHEQTKIISDFLTFIGGRMAQCEVWRSVDEAEFDNAREGMEKLVMNRLYAQCFSPEIPAPPSLPKNNRRDAPPVGRRGQHQEDVERDEVLAQKMRIYAWIKEEHLDIKPFSDKGRKFLGLAQQEFRKMGTYRAPRDKVIQVLNCCKVLFGYLRNASSDQSADAFIPILIYTVLKAKPDHLVSNVQYILRFRNQDKLTGEAGYYMSSLMGAVQFIESLDRTSLTISNEDFEQNVEQAVSAIAEKQPESAQPSQASALLPQHQQQLQGRPSSSPRRSSNPSLLFSEKSTPSRPEVTPRNSLEGEKATPARRIQQAQSQVQKRSGAQGSSASPNQSEMSSGSDESEENAAVAGLLRTIQKPLNSIGRIFADDQSSAPAIPPRPAATPQPGSTPRASPKPRSTSLTPSEQATLSANNVPPSHQERVRQRMEEEDAAARQASAESAEADQARRAEHATVVETLKGMFPDLDGDIIEDVVREKQGRVGKAVDACLALSR